MPQNRRKTPKKTMISLNRPCILVYIALIKTKSRLVVNNVESLEQSLIILS
jgi:hypothetical protein